MFEAADPTAFKWSIKDHGINVNMFIDHSQITQPECLCWGYEEPKAPSGGSSPIAEPPPKGGPSKGGRRRELFLPAAAGST